MKLSNWFKILWWIALLLLLSYAVYVRFPNFKTGNATAVDSLVLIIWFALALVPIFKEIELPGIKLKQEQEPPKNQLEVLKKNKEAAPTLVSSKTRETLRKFDSPLLTEQEDILKEEMKKINPSSEEEKDEILYRALASSQIAATFEKNYSIIYGSQLKALQYLNEKPGMTIDSDNLKYFYEEAKLRYPGFYASYSLENWLNYLLTSFLIVQSGEKVGISTRGKEFLKHIIDQMHSFNKIG